MKAIVERDEETEMLVTFPDGVRSFAVPSVDPPMSRGPHETGEALGETASDQRHD